MTTMGTSTANTAPLLNIQVNGVKKLLLGQNPNKASGPDHISPRFLKEMASSISPALMLIYQASYDQGQIPNDQKRAFVTFLFKRGNKSKAANYCQFHWHAVVAKSLYIVISWNFWESNMILSDFQHVFQKKRSVETQLITKIHDLAVGLDRHCKFWPECSRRTNLLTVFTVYQQH